jgi:hypothetical protein
MNEPDVSAIAGWALVIAALAFAGARRFGEGPAIAAALLAAVGTKAALFGLT